MCSPAIDECYAPASSEAAGCVATSPICCDEGYGVGDQLLRVPCERGCHGQAQGPRVVVRGNITGIPEAARRIWQQGWAPWKVGTSIHKVRPINMCCATHWAVMIFTPTEMGDLGCVDRPTQESVPKEPVGRISARCARSDTGLKISPTSQTLEEAAPSCRALPQDALDIVQCGG